MPRLPRICMDGALYYVTSRALEGRRLFRDERDYCVYQEFVRASQERLGFKLFAFVLLADQVHLCVELAHGVTISTVMHAINSRYTKHFGRRYGHAGHLFQERFKLTMVEKASSLLRLTGYVHTHPLRSGAAQDLRTFRWSSYPMYLAAGASVDGWSLSGEVEEVLQSLAQAHPSLSYEAFVQGRPADYWQQLGIALERPAVGSEAFLAAVAQHRKAAAEQPVTLAVSSHHSNEPLPQPRPSEPRPRVSVALTASVSLAFLSLCAAGLYAKNLSALQDTVRALAHERILQFSGSGEGRTASPEARLASFRLPIQLNGAAVRVEIRPIVSSAPDTFVQEDHLEFRDGQLMARQLGARGFSPARYTVNRREDGVVVWESIQADKTGTIVSWRGQWDGQIMRGLLTRRTPGQDPASYSFVGMATSQPGGAASMKEI